MSTPKSFIFDEIPLESTAGSAAAAAPVFTRTRAAAAANALRNNESIADYVNRVAPLNDPAAASMTRAAAEPLGAAEWNERKSSNNAYDADIVTRDLPSVLKASGAALAMGARAIWRAYRYGEKVGDADAAEDGESEAAAAAAAAATDQDESQVPVVPPIGGTGGSQSDYITHWKGKNRFQATAAWYMREAHHDPVGADPCMMSMFLVAFAARMFYSSFVEALILALIIDLLETVSWMALRYACPVIAREMNACESRWIALVYNLFAFFAGITTASFVLHTWPGLVSIWEALESKGCGSDGIFLLWAPCTDAETFVVVTLIYVLIFAASFRTLYPAATTGLLVLVAVAALAKTHLDVFNNVLVTALTSAYFLFWMAKPIGGTYVFNGLIALSFYLLAYSLAALSAA